MRMEIAWDGMGWDGGGIVANQTGCLGEGGEAGKVTYMHGVA